MIEQKISIIIGLWSEELFTEKEVVARADKKILDMNDDIYDS